MVIVTQYPDLCNKCLNAVAKGVNARWNPKTKKVQHLFCKPFDVKAYIESKGLTLES